MTQKAMLAGMAAGSDQDNLVSVPGSNQVSGWRVCHTLAARVGCARRTAPLQRRRGQSLFVPGQDTQLRLAWIQGISSDFSAVKLPVLHRARILFLYYNIFSTQVNNNDTILIKNRV